MRRHYNLFRFNNSAVGYGGRPFQFAHSSILINFKAAANGSGKFQWMKLRLSGKFNGSRNFKRKRDSGAEFRVCAQLFKRPQLLLDFRAVFQRIDIRILLFKITVQIRAYAPVHIQRFLIGSIILPG